MFSNLSTRCIALVRIVLSARIWCEQLSIISLKKIVPFGNSFPKKKTKTKTETKQTTLFRLIEFSWGSNVGSCFLRRSLGCRATLPQNFPSISKPLRALHFCRTFHANFDHRNYFYELDSYQKLLTRKGEECGKSCIICYDFHKKRIHPIQYMFADVKWDLYCLVVKDIECRIKWNTLCVISIITFQITTSVTTFFSRT